MTNWDASVDEHQSEDTGSQANGGGLTAAFVQGSDNRVPLSDDTDPDRHPWDCHCQIVSRFTGGLMEGTGWLVSARTLITAGHVVYSHRDGGWARDIRVRVPVGGTTLEAGELKAESFSTTKGWIELDPSGSFTFDYGVVFLAHSDAVVRSEYLRPASDLEAGSLDGAVGVIAGFPISHDDALMYHWDSLHDFPRALSYRIDTSRGQSGAPVLVKRDGKGYVAVGIHVEGRPGWNSAVRVRKGVVELIERWKASRA